MYAKNSLIFLLLLSGKNIWAFSQIFINAIKAHVVLFSDSYKEAGLTSLQPLFVLRLNHTSLNRSYSHTPPSVIVTFIRPRLRRKLRSHPLYLRGGARHAILLQVVLLLRLQGDGSPSKRGPLWGNINGFLAHSEGWPVGPGAYESNFSWQRGKWDSHNTSNGYKK